MAFLTLGLDLGISSIGWALLEEANNERKLLGWGSQIFEAGMDDDIESGKGVSRCAERRTKEALRKQYQRRQERKKKLIETMISGGLLDREPDAEFFNQIDSRLLIDFSPENRRQNAHLIPYLYRKKALDTVLKPEEVARALFHLAQRRGFLSNRKKDIKDEESGKVKSGIMSLQQAMTDAGARTLGDYFCTVDPETERIRTRYTAREMYINEFRMICAAQRQCISESLEKELYKAIFYQRPLKPCKHLIGKCRKYPELPRCSYAKEEAQLFRIYTTARNLRIDTKGTIRSLTDDEFYKTVEVLDSYSPLFKANGKIALSKLQKAIGLGKNEKITLGDEEKEIYGNELKNILFQAFGAKAEKLDEDERKKFFNDLLSIRKQDVLQRRLRDYWKLPEEKAINVSGMSMPDTYCAFSQKALQEMLPDLSGGIDLSTILK